MAYRRTDRSPPQARERGREGGRAIVACAALIALFVVAYLVGTGGTDSTHTAAATQAQRHGDDDLTTGSIVFVPTLGNQCRQRLIDNATWHIRDNGVVDCSTALSQNAGLRWSHARIDVIRNGFRKN